FPRTQPHPAVVGIAGGDAVIHDEPALGEQRPDFREISLEMAQAHVLEHADARDLVEHALARNIAVVLQAHLAAALEPLLPASLRCEFVLVPAERDARRAGAVVLGRAHNQLAPAETGTPTPRTRHEQDI